MGGGREHEIFRADLLLERVGFCFCEGQVRIYKYNLEKTAVEA